MRKRISARAFYPPLRDTNPTAGDLYRERAWGRGRGERSTMIAKSNIVNERRPLYITALVFPTTCLRRSLRRYGAAALKNYLSLSLSSSLQHYHDEMRMCAARIMRTIYAKQMQIDRTVSSANLNSSSRIKKKKKAHLSEANGRHAISIQIVAHANRIAKKSRAPVIGVYK